MSSREKRLATHTQPVLNPIDGALVVIACALVGARTVFVGSHWTYYSQHITETLWFWQGGLSWLGGAIGILAGILIFATVKRQPIEEIADLLALPLAFIATASWLGCLLEGCAYGRVVSTNLTVLNSSDIFGQIAPRWPTQFTGVLYGAFVILILLYYGNRLPRSGSIFLLSVLLISAGIFILSLTRGDPVLYYGDFRVDTVAAGIIVTSSLLVLIRSLRR